MDWTMSLSSGKFAFFCVDEESQRYMCFGCGKGGNLLEFLMRITGNSFLEVLSSLEQTNLCSSRYICKRKRKSLSDECICRRIFSKGPE